MLYTKFTQFLLFPLKLKRTRFVLSALLQGLLFFFFRDGLFTMATFLLFLLVSFLLQMITAYSQEIKRHYWIYILGFLLNLSMVLFYSVYPQLRGDVKAIFSLVFALFNYLYYLSSNIFLVSFERGRKIPLLKASLTVNRLLNLFILFFFYVASIKLWPNVLVQTLVIAVVTFVVTLYFFNVNNIEIERNKRYVKESLLVTIAITQIYISLIFRSLNFFYISLILTTLVYTFHDYIKNYLKYSLNKTLILSYFIINLGVLIIILVASY